MIRPLRLMTVGRSAESPLAAALAAWCRSGYVLVRRVRSDPIAAIFAIPERLPGGPADAILLVLEAVLGLARHTQLWRGLVRPMEAAVRASRGSVERAHVSIEQDLRTLTDPIGRARLAQVALRSGRTDLAERALKGLDDPSPTVQEARAIVLIRTGRLDGGEQALTRLIERGEASTTAREHLAFVRGRNALLQRRWSWTPTTPPPRRPVPGRILHMLTNSLPYTQAGYTIRSHSVGRCQQAVGLDPHFVTRAGFPELQGHLGASPREDIEGVPYHRIAAQARGRLADDEVAGRTADGILDLASKLRPSCLHPATYHFNAQVALAVASRLGLPVVYEVRGFLEDTWLSTYGEEARNRAHYRWSREAETQCMLQADHVVTLSHVMQSEIAARGVPLEKITVVPNAVDENRFFPAAPQRALRHRLGIPEHASVVGYIGSLVDYEGLPVLLDALACLRAEGRGVHLLCVGDGPELKNLCHRAHRLELEDAATFTGRVPHDDIVDYYRLLDVFVAPRRDRRVCRLVAPLKPMEAMACAIPTVVSDLPPLIELTGHGVAGPSFAPEDARSLAETLDDVLHDEERRRAYGRGARERVLAHYTWTRNARTYRELYESLGVA